MSFIKVVQEDRVREDARSKITKGNTRPRMSRNEKLLAEVTKRYSIYNFAILHTDRDSNCSYYAIEGKTFIKIAIIREAFQLVNFRKQPHTTQSAAKQKCHSPEATKQAT